MSLTISYRLTGIGWAECVISDSQTSCSTTASYLSDALGSLVRAAIALLTGFSALTFSFEEEPGEYRWVIRSPRYNEIELRILDFPDVYSALPEADGRLLFQTVCVPETFAMAVFEAAERLRIEIGEAGYAEKWVEHPFPTPCMDELKRTLQRLGHAV